MTIFGGMIAGILNITGIFGFLFFFIYSILIGIILYIIVNSISNGKTFFYSNSSLITQNLTTNFMTYLIFWVMFYNFVHIYAY